MPDNPMPDPIPDDELKQLQKQVAEEQLRRWEQERRGKWIALFILLLIIAIPLLLIAGNR